MMKFRTIIILLSALLPAVMHAAGSAGTSASEVLRQAVATMKKAPSIEAAFTATSGNVSTSGNILLSGNRFKLSTPDITTWFDGRTQWAYSPAAVEVNLSEPTAEALRHKSLCHYRRYAGRLYATTPAKRHRDRPHRTYPEREE